MMGILLAQKYVEDKRDSTFAFTRSSVDAPVYRILIAQLIVTVLASLSSLFVDWVVAYSILLGGTVCVVPAGFAAWRLGQKTPGPGAAMIHMVVAQTGKLLLTAALFAVIFVKVKPLNLVFFFGTIIALHSFYILMPIIKLRGSNARTRD